MPYHDFRPRLFSPDEGLWKVLSVAALFGGAALIGWLAGSEPEPSAYSSEAWTELPIPLNEEIEVEASATEASFQSYDTAGPLDWQLQNEAEHGKVRPALLLETFIEKEEERGGGDSKRLMEEFLKRSAYEASYLDPIDQLAELKAQMMSDPDLVYVSDAFTFTEALLEDRLQCQSSTMLIVLAWLQQKTTQWAGGPRPVLVMSPNHVQPGLLYEGALHLMEGTSRGDRVAKLHLAQLGDVRILDAADALTWSLLQKDTPDRIKDRMLLYDNHSGIQRFAPGSGSSSWIHLPLSFGGPIVLSSTPREISENSDPAKGVLAETQSGTPEALNEPIPELSTKLFSTTDSWGSIAESEVRMELTCSCRMEGVQYPPRHLDPCDGRRRTPSGGSCDLFGSENPSSL
jgi:hypothetical protein